jgi:hypothetical protein
MTGGVSRRIQLLTEIDIKNLPGGKGTADNFIATVSRVSRKRGSLDISESFASSKPVTGRALYAFTPVILLIPSQLSFPFLIFALGYKY